MRLRVQIIQPCMASCKWCGTFKKNRIFEEMVKNGRSEKVHDEYKKLIEDFRPEFLYLSGGEPLLSKNIDSFVKDVSPFVRSKIFIFTSFQYPKSFLDKISLNQMPFDKVVLTHTTAGFDRDIWNEMTGFSFDLYIENIKRLTKLPWQKRVKFIINNRDVRKEIDLFKSVIDVKDDFSFNLKLVNEQSKSSALGLIKETPKDKLRSIKEKLKESFGDVDQELTGVDIIEKHKEEKEDIKCRFRESFEELRFSFYTSNSNGIKLKYRFCPFFPLDKHYKYKIGRDSSKIVLESLNKKKWHNWCSKCRLKHYL